MQSISVNGFRRAALPCLILGVLALPLQAPAEAPEGYALTEVEVAAASEAGTEVLAEVAEARAAIAKGDGTAARKSIARARAQLGEVRAMSPAVRFEHEVGKVLGKLANQKAAADDLLPVYAELDLLRDPEKAAEVRAHLDRAKGHLEVLEEAEGARRPVTAPQLDAEAMLQKWRSASDELIEACSKVSYLEIDLPIHETYALLRRAQLGLLHNDLPAADSALAEVQDRVQVFVARGSAGE